MVVRRLFSTFANGWPGAGLLLLRVTSGSALVAHGIATMHGEPQLGTAVIDGFAAGAGLMLVVGLWTPIAGTIVALIEISRSVSQSGNPWTHILLASLGAALALVGPGAWSVDARLFGWKRINIPDRKS
jgi:putative oxidoreductase